MAWPVSLILRPIALPHPVESDRPQMNDRAAVAPLPASLADFTADLTPSPREVRQWPKDRTRPRPVESDRPQMYVHLRPIFCTFEADFSKADR